MQAVIAALVGRRSFWVLLLAVPAAWPVAWALKTGMPPPLPVLAQLPPFELLDQRGHSFGTAELTGRVWIASVGDVGRGTGRDGARTMALVQARTRNLEPALHLVTVSAAAGSDTPSSLAASARHAGANPRMWSFVGGEPAARNALARALRVDPRDPRLALVDARGRVRGYYAFEDPSVVSRLVRDAALLVNRGE